LTVFLIATTCAAPVRFAMQFNHNQQWLNNQATFLISYYI
jgi:hypothetical protein